MRNTLFDEKTGEDVITSGAPATKSVPKVRRTHAERSATTRAKLLKAAIDCLHQYGYGATSTVLVTNTAKLSRGAMQHQFPTKVDLMLAVIEYAMAEQDTERRHMLREYERGYTRFIAASEVVWKTAMSPLALALLEIEIGARSDPELAERAPPIFHAAAQRQLDSVWEVAQDLGLTDRERVDQLTLMNVATERGLTIALLTATDPAPFEKAFQLMVENKKRTVDEMLSKEREKAKGAKA
jgi:AcrR family transcriptional regulator